MASVLRIAVVRRGPSSRGFTLIELMIVVIVIGVLAAVALPSFLDSIRKGRRAEAFAALAAIQQAQERWRSNNPQYASNLAALAIASPTRPGGYYALNTYNNTATGFEVSAFAVAGTSQANDGDCARLALRVQGGNISYASCANCASSAMAFTTTDKCWAK